MGSDFLTLQHGWTDPKREFPMSIPMPPKETETGNAIRKSILRRPFLWASERWRRPFEPQLASPPVATRNGLARPTRIGAPSDIEPANEISSKATSEPKITFNGVLNYHDNFATDYRDGLQEELERP